jgi:hypothetical protein
MNTTTILTAITSMKIFQLIIIAALILSAFATGGCDNQYFENNVAGTWRGSAQVTLVNSSGILASPPLTTPTTAVSAPREETATFVLSMVQQPNSQNIQSAFSAPPPPLRSFINADSILAGNPLSVIDITNIAGDSTFAIDGRNANANTVFFTVAARTYGSSQFVAMSFTGTFKDANTIEGILSQTLPRQRVLVTADTAAAILLEPRTFNTTLTLTR